MIDAGWDGSLSLEPKDLTRREVQIILDSRDVESEETRRASISKEYKHYQVLCYWHITCYSKIDLESPVF